MNIDWTLVERLTFIGHRDKENKVVYVRTIKNGTVKIMHKIYTPSTAIMQYDGRLDGMRYAFWEYEHHMSLSMTELAWRMILTPYAELFLIGPEIVNGVSPWRTWHPR